MRTYYIAVTGLLVILGGIPAMAETGTQSASPLYNTSSNTSTAAKPVFLNSATVTPATSSSIQPFTSQNTAAPQSDSDRRAMNERVARENQQKQDSRMADIRAQYDAQRDKDEAADNAKIQERLKAAQVAQAGGGAAPAAATAQGSLQKVDPYAGKTVVWTGKKKEGADKPVRLFNVR